MRRGQTKISSQHKKWLNNEGYQNNDKKVRKKRAAYRVRRPSALDTSSSIYFPISRKDGTNLSFNVSLQ